MTQIQLNGEAKETAARATIPELRSGNWGWLPEMLLIEHNGVALHRSEWEKAALAAGDRVEMLRVAAGG